MVAFDRLDVPATPAVDGESTCYLQRLSGCDVVGDLLVGQVGELDCGHADVGRPADGATGGDGHQRMPGVQLAALAAHLAPSGNGAVGGQWLSVSDAVDLEQGVAA